MEILGWEHANTERNIVDLLIECLCGYLIIEIQKEI